MVFIETPTSRAAWKTATGAAETRAGSIPHAAHPIPFDDSRTYPIRPKATQPPISTLADRPGSATPARGVGAPDVKEVLVGAIMHSCAVSQGGRDLQADFMGLADRCFGPCGTAARRGSRGTPVGD